MCIRLILCASDAHRMRIFWHVLQTRRAGLQTMRIGCAFLDAQIRILVTIGYLVMKFFTSLKKECKILNKDKIRLGVTKDVFFSSREPTNMCHILLSFILPQYLRCSPR